MKLSQACLSLAFVGLVSLAGGCLVVDGGSNAEDCSGTCTTEEVCETYCGPSECWEECWRESTCSPECPGYEEPDGAPCMSNSECGGDNAFCVDGRCRAPSDDDDTGPAGLCQSCEVSSDCAGDNAACISLNIGDPDSRQKVCGRACQSAGDCPSGFDCVDVGGGPGISDQCLPAADADGQRTCSIPEGEECISSADCDSAESCVNNQCRKPNDAECTSNGDCEDGEVCRDYQCESGCISASDCPSDETCFDGQCTERTQECTFNDECDEDGRCVNGECRSRCDPDASEDQCGSQSYCRQGLCTPVDCRHNGDCATGEVCINASCRDKCDADSGCAAGYICDSLGYCEPDPEVECRSNAECSRDEVCRSGSCRTLCSCNSQCSDGEVCAIDDGDSTGACVQDCPSGQNCDTTTCE